MDCLDKNSHGPRRCADTDLFNWCRKEITRPQLDGARRDESDDKEQTEKDHPWHFQNPPSRIGSSINIAYCHYVPHGVYNPLNGEVSHQLEVGGYNLLEYSFSVK